MLSFATIVAFILVIVGGKQRHEQGWRVLIGCLSIVAIGQVVGLGLVAYVYRTDGRFFEGWELGRSFWLVVGSVIAQVVIGAGVVGAALGLEEEGGYELIPEPPRGARRR